MDFAKRLKKYRLAIGCTQKEMALMLGITERGYRNYELGTREPNLSFLVALADKLNVSLDDLVGKETPKNPLVDME